MQHEKAYVDVFVRKVLICMKEQRLTKEAVRERYLLLYPPGLIKRKILPPLNVKKIEQGLKVLTELDFVSREITRWYEGESLLVDTALYHITEKGRSFLHQKKK